MGKSKQHRSSPCPVYYKLLAEWREVREKGKYQVCQMALSTMEKNKARKGFAIVNRVEQKALTEKVAFEWRPEGGLKFSVNNYSSVCLV